MRSSGFVLVFKFVSLNHQSKSKGECIVKQNVRVYHLVSILVDALANIYKSGEQQLEIKTEKIVTVTATPSQFKLSMEAREVFTVTHDEFEDVTRRNSENNFMAGMTGQTIDISTDNLLKIRMLRLTIVKVHLEFATVGG